MGPMNAAAAAAKPEPSFDMAALNAMLAKYKDSHLPSSLWQIANTAIPFFSVWALMYLTAYRGYWPITLLLAVPASGLLMRMFIIQHDCGHGSFFKSGRANDWVGAVIGVFTLTPYTYWKQTHAIHHSTSGNLDRRGYGDIETLTVREYAALSPWGRWKYRAYRSIPVLFFIGPAFHFVVYHRWPGIIPSDWKSERRSILLNDLALVGLLYIAHRTVGLGPFCLVQLAVGIMTAIAGVWLFYVQHQFEGTYWRKDDNWDLVQASLHGSSYFELPRVLQWLTGNIGFHHIHHLNSRIPNYKLERCMNENPVLQNPVTLTFWKSFKCVSLTLWDEERQKLVGFSAVGV
jgi:omega-6 fatty acid desaturase (delta-12 desaturase)